MQLIQIKIITIIFLILFSSCIVLQITVYRRTREILVNYGRSNSGSASIPELLDVHISESSINRLEIEATTTLIASVTSLSLVTGPILLYTFVTFMCRLYFENSVCSSISWLSPYVKALIVLHIVYHPTFYFLHSSELSSVLKNWSFVFSQ